MRHKSSKNGLLIRASCYALVAVVLVTVSLPQSALAYEAKLAHSPASKLVAHTRLARYGKGQIDAMMLPNYSYCESGLVVAQLVPETKLGNWQETKLAYRDTAGRTEVDSRVLVKRETPLVLEGEASYYSRSGCLGCDPALIMANGQSLDDGALTIAIGADKKYLVGHRATVTNLTTGQSVEVQITDTGGFYQAQYGNRVADLTIATKQAIGMSGGIGYVRVKIH